MSSPVTTNVTSGGGINPTDKVTLVISGADHGQRMIQLHVDTSLVLDRPEPESLGSGEERRKEGDSELGAPAMREQAAPGRAFLALTPGGPFCSRHG